MYSSWAVGGGVGPVIGGSLAQSGHWYVLLSLLALSASWFSLDRISFQEMAVLCVLLVSVSSFQRVVNRVQTSTFQYACLTRLLSCFLCALRHHVQL
jgi:hypothetical protein